MDLGRVGRPISGPRLTPEATHGLLVDRPALAIQQSPDPSVSESRMDGRRVPRSAVPTPTCSSLTTHRVTQAGPCQVQRPRDATLRDAVKCSRSSSGDETASGRGHGFFFKASWSMRRSRASSATRSLSRPTSSSSSERRGVAHSRRGFLLEGLPAVVGGDADAGLAAGLVDVQAGVEVGLELTEDLGDLVGSGSIFAWVAPWLSASCTTPIKTGPDFGGQATSR